MNTLYKKKYSGILFMYHADRLLSKSVQLNLHKYDNKISRELYQ